MTQKEITEIISDFSKEELKAIIKAANAKLNSTINIGDEVYLTIHYMIGDANGNTEEVASLDIETQDDLDALTIIRHLLDNYTEPNKGTWGFIMDDGNWSAKPGEVYNLLYNQEEAPEEYLGIKINKGILDMISRIKDEAFTGDTEYSFLVYEGYEITQ